MAQYNVTDDLLVFFILTFKKDLHLWVPEKELFRSRKRIERKYLHRLIPIYQNSSPRYTLTRLEKWPDIKSPCLQMMESWYMMTQLFKYIKVQRIRWRLVQGPKAGMSIDLLLHWHSFARVRHVHTFVQQSFPVKVCFLLVLTLFFFKTHSVQRCVRYVVSSIIMRWWSRSHNWFPYVFRWEQHTQFNIFM